MSIATMLAIAGVSLAGSALQSAVGFGYGIFVMIFFPYLLPSQPEATALSGILALVSCGTVAFRWRRRIRWRLLAPVLPAYFLMSTLVIRFAAQQPDSLLRSLLGGALILFALYFAWFQQRLHVRANPVVGVLAGVVGGTLSGLFSTGGPPLVLYYTAAAQDKEEYMATIQATFFITNFYQAFVRAANGLVTHEVLLGLPLSVIAMLAGVVLGQRAFRRMDTAQLRRALCAVIGLGGLVMLLR